MSKTVKYNGKTYNFPDDASNEEITSSLDQFENKNTNSDFNQKSNFGLFPDIGAGLIHGLQSIVPQASDFLPSSMHVLAPFLRRPEPAAQFIQPGNQNIDPYKLMGTQEQPITTNKGLAQTAGELLPLATSLTKLPEAMKYLGEVYKQVRPSSIKNIAYQPIDYFKSVQPSVVGRNIQASHDALKNDASNIFNNVKDEAINRNISNVPVDEKTIKKAKKYLPKTDASNDLIKNALTGDYSSLRDLQTDLFKEGTSAQQHELMSERHLGDEAMELRDKINKSIYDHFVNTGNSDLADALKDGMNKYFKLKDIYYGNNTIGKLVGEDRVIPKNLISVLQEDSKPMEKLKNENPYLRDVLSRNKKVKAAKIVGAALATGTLGSLGYNVAKNLI